MIPDIAFHRTSNRPIPLKLVRSPLGIITTVCQAHTAVISPPLKDACIRATTFSYLPGSRRSSRIAAQIHILRCSALMMGGPPARCSRSRSTACTIPPYPRILSSTGKGATYMEHEGDGPPFHTTQPTQVLRHPGQVPLSWYPGGVWSGDQYTPYPADILVPAPYGGKGGG